MTKVNLRKIWWLIVIFYVVVIYVSLGYMPSIWDNIDALLDGKGVVALYILYSLAGFFFLYYIIFVKKDKSLKKYIVFFMSIVLFLIMIKLEKNPGEKIHMAEYGLLGIFLYNALKIDFDIYKRQLYVYGSIISLIIGAVDEVIQFFLPNRVFTWHDVFVNGLSGIIVPLIIKFIILEK